MIGMYFVIAHFILSTSVHHIVVARASSGNGGSRWTHSQLIHKVVGLHFAMLLGQTHSQGLWGTFWYDIIQGRYGLLGFFAFIESVEK